MARENAKQRAEREKRERRQAAYDQAATVAGGSGVGVADHITLRVTSALDGLGAETSAEGTPSEQKSAIARVVAINLLQYADEVKEEA